MQLGPKSEIRGVALGDVVNWLGSVCAILVFPFVLWVHASVVELKTAVARLEGVNEGKNTSSLSAEPSPAPAPQPFTVKAALAAVVPQRVELPGGKK